MSYCRVQLIKNWHELMRIVENIVEVINETQKVGSIDSTPYKAGPKFDISKKI